VQESFGVIESLVQAEPHAGKGVRSLILPPTVPVCVWAVWVAIAYVCTSRFGGTSTRAYTRTQARGATPELRRVTDTTSHGLSAGRHSTQTTIGSPSLCDRPEGWGGRDSIAHSKQNARRGEVEVTERAALPYSRTGEL